MTDKHVKRYSLSRQVADQLEKMIADGVYAVGDKIPTEPELTKMFGVSRNTLREAVQSLTAAGILQVRQGDGTYVRSDNRFRANMNMKYDQISLDDILEARNVLEIAIARLASQRRTDEDLVTLRQALKRRSFLTEAEKQKTRADIAFHMEIAKACHNRILFDLYTSMSSYLESHIADRQEETALSSQEIDILHERLYSAILDQNPDAASICAQNILAI